MSEPSAVVTVVCILLTVDSGCCYGGVRLAYGTMSGVVTVVCTLIRESRCSMMISYSLFKYMVLYGFVESIVACCAFLVASTRLSVAQVNHAQHALTMDCCLVVTQLAHVTASQSWCEAYKCLFCPSVEIAKISVSLCVCVCVRVRVCVCMCVCVSCCFRVLLMRTRL